jgi:hypothetical protein
MRHEKLRLSNQGAASPQKKGESAFWTWIARDSQAYISSTTGLASDDLNHFNKTGECIADFLDWCTMTSCEHFASSSFTERNLVTVAHGVAAPAQPDGHAHWRRHQWPLHASTNRSCGCNTSSNTRRTGPVLIP